MNISNKIDNWNEVLLQTDTKIKQVVDQGTGSYYFEVAKYNNDNSLACRAINFIKEKTNVDLRFSFLNIGKVMFTTKHEKNLEEFIRDYHFDVNSGNFAYTNVTVKEFDAIKRSNALDKVMERELPIQVDEIVGADRRSHTAKNKFVLIQKSGPVYTDTVILDTPKGDKNEIAMQDSFTNMLNQLSKGENYLRHQANQVFQNNYGRGRGKTSLTKAYVRQVYKDLAETKQIAVHPVPETPKEELDDFAKELIAEFSKPEHKNTVKIVKSKDLGRGR